MANHLEEAGSIILPTTRGSKGTDLYSAPNKTLNGSDYKKRLNASPKSKNKGGKRLKGAKNRRKVEKIRLNNIVPMPEVDRQFYNQFDYLDLKRLIEKDGYDEAYPIRVLWNDEKKVYEAFDGIHRLKIEKELGSRSTIPAIDETSFLTRSLAVAKGIKANKFRSPYNPIDLARSLKALGEDLVKAQTRKKSVGRPKDIDESEIASVMRMSQSKVSQLLQLLKLPKDVQNLIGQGKLKFWHSLILTKLLGTRYENKISELAKRVIENEMATRQLERVVEAIKSKGFFEDEARCDSCKRMLPSDSISRPHLCVICMGKLRSGELDKSLVESHNEARRKYLKLRAFMERHFPNNTVPEHFKIVLNGFHKKWNGDSEEPEPVSNESFLEHAKAHPHHYFAEG